MKTELFFVYEYNIFFLCFKWIFPALFGALKRVILPDTKFEYGIIQSSVCPVL